MLTIGTCSKCNGPVQMPDFWGGTVPPVPTCAHCGATAKDPYGPTIPMEKRPSSRTGAQQPAAVDEAYPTPRNRAEAVALARLALAHLGVIDAHIDAAIARCETDCRCIDCGGNQPGHDPTCGYMHDLHGEQPAAAGVDANELTGVRARLKSGDYDGADVMRAWLAIDKLLALRERLGEGAEP